MLGLLAVQVLAACSLLGALASVFLGGMPSASLRTPVRVVARRNPGRWAEVVWPLGTVVAVAWPLLVLFAPQYGYDRPPTPNFPGSTEVQLFGFVLAIAGGILFFAARRALGRHMTPAIQVREDHQLVQEGPYRYIRHPAYTAILAAAGGFSVLFLSPVLAADTLLLLGMAVYRARLEEQLLGSPEGFGSVYAAYVARTGRFLPRFRSRRDEGTGPTT